MSETQESPTHETLMPSRGFLSRLGIAGIVFVVVYAGIGTGLWLLFGGLDQFTRVLLAVCAPSVLLSIGLGLYMLIVPDRAASGS